MVDSIVSSGVQWIGSLLIEEGAALLAMEDNVRALQNELESIQPYLQDAETKREDRRIDTLVRQTRELVYDAEDVVDMYILKVQANGHRKREKLLKPAKFLYNIVHIRKVGKQIQEIMGGLKEVAEKFNSYGVRKTLEYYRVDQSRKQNPRSYAYDDDDIEYTVGWEKDTAKLVEMLVGEGNAHIRFVSIVGMGGSGKTTLARKLYNHPYVKECFHYFAWVFISQEWSTRHVLHQILRKVGGHAETIKLDSTVDEFVDRLRSILENKSYLIVLDDVWSRQVLKEILPALPQQKSKIVITTRNQEILEFLTLQQNQYIYQPTPLNDKESWELFHKIVFNNDGINNMESSENLAKEMLKKCDGLPLAIVALSGILRTKRGINEWQEVNRAVRVRVMEGAGTHKNGKVGDMLALSYDDLPYHLKPCFLYLSVFPEDCQIPVGMLTRMWIAEGLVTSREGMSLEEVAMQQVEELSHRFMVQIAWTNFKGKIKAIRLHDLLRDLSIKKAREQSFLEIYGNMGCQNSMDAPQFTTEPRRYALHSRS